MRMTDRMLQAAVERAWYEWQDASGRYDAVEAMHRWMALSDEADARGL